MLIRGDNLAYAYQTNNANQLYTVTDSTSNQTGFGIQTGGSAGGHYTYDVNGNLKNDPYKNLSINYDMINKTDKITMPGYTGRYVYYVYDGTGTVLEKQQWDANALVHTTVYMDEFVYIDGVISYITTPEGRANYNGGAFTNEYVITDQQGNARVSFNNTGASGARAVVQENSYYGFGMVMPGSVVSPGDNKNLYNGGSEWQNDYGNLPDYYQTPMRNYDAALGRFIAQDPMAEATPEMSTYHYAGDNPIMSNDPTGNLKSPINNTSYPQGYTGIPDVARYDAPDIPYEAYDEDDVDGGGGDYSGFWNAFMGQVFGPRNGYDLTFNSEAMDELNTYYNKVGDGNFRLGFYNGRVVEAVAPWSDSAPQSSSQTASLSESTSSGSSQSDYISYVSNNSGEGSSIGFSSGGAGGDLWDKYGFAVENKTRTGDGALFIVDFKDPGNGNGMYNWIQTVSSSGEFDKLNGLILPQPHIDGPRWTSGKLQNSPFIYGTFNPDTPHSGMTSTFDDIAHGETWFAAELTLILRNADGTITAKGTFIWGYNKAFPTMFLGPLFYTTPSTTQRGAHFYL